MAALAEGMALAEKCDLDPLTLLEVFLIKLNFYFFIKNLF